MKKSILLLVLAKALAVAALSGLFTLQCLAQPNINVHSGNASLILHNARANYTGLTLTSNITYTLSYWVKALAAGTKIGVTLSTTVQGSGTFTDEGSAVMAGGYQSSTTADGEWHQYFAKITPNKTSSIFAFGIDVRPSPAYIDDVVLVSAASSAINLVADPGFEAAYQSHFTGDGNGWPTANWVDLRWTSEYAWDTHQSGQPDGSKALTIEGTPAIAHSGYASLILHTARANYHIGSTLTSNTTYTLSYWVKALDAGAKIGVTLADDVPGVYPPILLNLNSKVTAGGYGSYTSIDDQWHQYFATITPTATSDLLTFGIDVRPQPAYIDDVVLRATGSAVNLVQDAGFETAYQSHFNGDGQGWPTANWVDLRWYSEYAWDTHKYGNPSGPKALSLEGISTIVNRGNRSLRVNKEAVRANYTGLSLTAGINYTLTYWVKTETDAPIGVTLSTTVPGNGTFTDLGSAVKAGGYASSRAPDENWKQYTATITPSITTNIYAFGIDCRPKVSDFYIDDVVLVAEGSALNLVGDPGFETAYQSHVNGDGNGWPTANWVDLRWTSEYAWQIHQYGSPSGPRALYIEAAPPADESPVPSTAPTLTVTKSGANLVLDWSGGGTLQSSSSVDGTFSNIIGSSSPWNVAPTNSQSFFRVKQ